MKVETIRQLFIRVRRHYGDSYAKFGRRLAGVQGRRPYSDEYIRLLEAGKKPITASIAAALHLIAAALHLISPEGAVETTVLPAPGVAVEPGAICFRATVPCGSCGRPMIPRRNRFCSAACRRTARQAA